MSVFHKILSETNGAQLKIDGWKTIVPFCDGLFSEANSWFLGNVFPKKVFVSTMETQRLDLKTKPCGKLLPGVLWQTFGIGYFGHLRLMTHRIASTGISPGVPIGGTHEPILQGILDWGPLEFPLNFLVGIYGCEGKQKKLKLEKEKNMKTQSVGFPCI